MIYLVGPLIAIAGIVALLLVLRTRARTTNRSLYSTAREDRARKVREARELALRSAAPAEVEVEPLPEPQAEPAYVPQPPPAPTVAVETPPEPMPEAPPEPEPEPATPEPEPVMPEVPAWMAAPARATNPPAAASTASVDEPAWLPARTNPPVARRAPGTPAPAAAATAVEDDAPPPPRMASTVVSYVVLAASLIVILLGIAIMIGMSRG